MRNWKNWLFPLTTCLIVLGLALLPLWLSVREDSQLTGVVHSEDLREDSNFPAKAPELAGRIRLLAMLETFHETLTIMERELEGAALKEAVAGAWTELQSMADAGILPPEAVSELPENYSGRRVYTRDQTDLSSASFLYLDIWAKEQDTYFSLYLDGETGQVLALRLSGVPMVKIKKDYMDTLKTGRMFLDRLGAAYTEEQPYVEEFTSIFCLAEGQTQYIVRVHPYGVLSIAPQMDWEQLEQMAREGEVFDDNRQTAGSYDS